MTYDAPERLAAPWYVCESVSEVFPPTEAMGQSELLSRRIRLFVQFVFQPVPEPVTDVDPMFTETVPVV